MVFMRKKDASKTLKAPMDLVEAELAKDTIASILRTLAEFALPTSRFRTDEFQDRCEKLALEVLTKKETPESGEAPPRSDKQAHKEVRQLVREQRQVESDEYQAHRESVKVVIEGLITNLRLGLTQKDKDTAEIKEQLKEIERAAGSDAVRPISPVIAGAIQRILGLLKEQRNREAEQLSRLSEELQKLREELSDARAQLRHDVLTGLLNRKAFDEAAEKTVDKARTGAGSLTIYSIEVDRFQAINDAHSRQVGNEVLRSVAAKLMASFPRTDDAVARYAGETFSVLCPDVGEDNAQMLAERASRAVQDLEIKADETAVRPTISVGYAILDPQESAQQCIERAYRALGDAKKRG